MYRSCATPRSLSQLTTSFFASQTLGIHHVLLFALKFLIYNKYCYLLPLLQSLEVVLGFLPILFLTQYVKDL